MELNDYLSLIELMKEKIGFLQTLKNFYQNSPCIFRESDFDKEGGNVGMAINLGEYPEFEGLYSGGFNFIENLTEMNVAMIDRELQNLERDLIDIIQKGIVTHGIPYTRKRIG